jgi:hypothetical protein
MRVSLNVSIRLQMNFYDTQELILTKSYARSLQFLIRKSNQKI